MVNLFLFGGRDGDFGWDWGEKADVSLENGGLLSVFL